MQIRFIPLIIFIYYKSKKLKKKEAVEDKILSVYKYPTNVHLQVQTNGCQLDSHPISSPCEPSAQVS